MAELDAKHIKKKSLDKCLRDANDQGKLNLSGRKLKTMSNVHLTDLYGVLEADVSRNRFNEVDWLMHICDYMQTLNCSHNCIKTINDVHLLKCLTVLDLSYNKLTSLPPGLGQLPISILNVSHNRIAALSTEISMLQALQDLDISYNELSSLPDIIVELKKLRELRVRHNSLTQLPIDLGLLRLSKLDVSFNQISHLPSSLSRMCTLDILIVNDNPLVSPPSKICSLGRLHIFKYLSKLDTHEEDTVSELSLSSVATIDTTSSTQSSSLTSDASQLPIVKEEPSYRPNSTISNVKVRQNDAVHRTASVEGPGIQLRISSISNHDNQPNRISPKQSPLLSQKPVRLYSEPPDEMRGRTSSTPLPPTPARRQSSLRIVNGDVPKTSRNSVELKSESFSKGNDATVASNSAYDYDSPATSTDFEIANGDDEAYDEEYDSSTLTYGKNGTEISESDQDSIDNDLSPQPPPRLTRSPAIKQKNLLRRFASNESLKLFDNDLIREERRRMAKKLQQQQQELISRQRSDSFNLNVQNSSNQPSSPSSPRSTKAYSAERNSGSRMSYGSNVDEDAPINVESEYNDSMYPQRNRESYHSVHEDDLTSNSRRSTRASFDQRKRESYHSVHEDDLMANSSRSGSTRASFDQRMRESYHSVHEDDLMSNSSRSTRASFDQRKRESYHSTHEDDLMSNSSRSTRASFDDEQSVEKAGFMLDVRKSRDYERKSFDYGEQQGQPIDFRDQPPSLPNRSRTNILTGSPTKQLQSPIQQDARWRVVTRPEIDQIELTRQDMEEILQVNIGENFPAALSDGILLCYVVNTLRPRTIGRIHEPSADQPELSQAKRFQNVSSFIDICNVYGVPKHRLCSVGDILNERDILRICATIQEIITILRG